MFIFEPYLPVTIAQFHSVPSRLRCISQCTDSRKQCHLLPFEFHGDNLGRKKLFYRKGFLAVRHHRFDRIVEVVGSSCPSWQSAYKYHLPPEAEVVLSPTGSLPKDTSCDYVFVHILCLRNHQGTHAEPIVHPVVEN